jgi:hypothetical protein
MHKASIFSLGARFKSGEIVGNIIAEYFPIYDGIAISIQAPEAFAKSWREKGVSMLDQNKDIARFQACQGWGI